MPDVSNCFRGMPAAACYFAWGCFRYFGGAHFEGEFSHGAVKPRSGEDVNQTHKHECADACHQDRTRRASDPEQQESGAHAGKGQQFRSQRDRAAFPPCTATTTRSEDGEQPVFEPRRRSCKAGRGEDGEWRGREHRQECADKTEGDEDESREQDRRCASAATFIQAVDLPLRSSAWRRHADRSTPARFWRPRQACLTPRLENFHGPAGRMMRQHRRRWSSVRKSASIGVETARTWPTCLRRCCRPCLKFLRGE